ncbi:molybdopterin molybdenumtransferase MoeA [Antarcticibacterium sp. W02-3]|uniref:molybdopterin molybdotransferase MoeA n=1 Tax=Antarcticibacterium sp. W02-3 TaxID=2183747 RepID=UPI00204361A5|nr:gephyrin-like molybdotransferase Glp [Antarcticibacterium sp. W02-3]MCM4158290.1 molybdopterin molybdenumtransferase MoeA [Antarcticibacterium sp. W02-3]
MISVNDARRILSENLERAKSKNISLNDSLGLILAVDVYSPIDVPSFDNSAMDGYAMKFDSSRNSWESGSVIQAGDTNAYKVKEGTAARIFTGAKIPQGVDTVIPQELIERDEATGRISYDQDKIQTGSNIRLKGSQCKKEELIAEKGTPVTPGLIGLLASVGLNKVEVYTPATVTYIITGDELKEAGTALKEGEIYNSNGPMLEALLKNAGIKEISGLKATDDKEELQEKINKALAASNVLIISGGISVGDYDFVKECLEKAGVKELFYKIKQRPGKPMYAGRKGDKYIFALPGNPASVLSCFNQYVKPSLKYLAGKEKVWEADAVLSLAADQKKKEGLTFFLKGRMEQDEVIIPGGQQSFNLLAFSTANCLVELEEDKEEIKARTPVNVFYL